MRNFKLVVICGVPTSGKTTFINNIINCKDPSLLDLLNIEENEKFNFINANKLFASKGHAKEIL